MAACESVSLAAAPKALGKGVGKTKCAPPPKGLSKGLGKGLLKSGAPPLLPRGARPNPEELGPKLRPLFWTAVPQVPADSVWSDLVTPAAFDKAELERLFALTDLRSAATGKGGASSRASSEEPRKRLRVLDDRTSQLLAIAFSKLPAPEQLAEMVDKFENFPDGLTPEAVIALHNAVNEHKDAVDQIRQVAVTQEAIAQLDMPEKFLLRLTAVDCCLAKLSCGALLVGQARELHELRSSVREVGICSQMLRKSGLLRKCMSTSLAVGNILNRGTARSGVLGVVLPDSLLKLDELRGNVDTNIEVGDRSGGSVLDFVAQALVNEDDSDLQKNAEHMLLKARFASGISLEEAETNFRQVSAEVKKTLMSLNEIPESTGKTQIAIRVHRVSEEVAHAMDLAQQVRKELTKTQQWSCCKGQPKSDDWFASWVQFLEIFVRALAKAQEQRARLRDEMKKRTTQEEKKVIGLSGEERQVVPPCANAARTPLCNINLDEAPIYGERAKTSSGSSSRGSSVSKRKGGCILDDDAKLDLSKVDFGQLLARSAEFPDKENSSR